MKKLIIPPVFLLLSFISIVLLFIITPGLNLVAFPFNLAGIFIAFAGFVIMGKARDLFRKHQTTLDIAKSSALISEGVFSKTRNPMYAGMFLLLLGIAVCFQNILGICIAFLFIVIIHLVFVRHEEDLMEQVFGDEYRQYARRVKRWL